MNAVIDNSGQVHIDGHNVGQINGVLFTPSNAHEAPDKEQAQAEVYKALNPEIDRRLMQITGCDQAALLLSDTGDIIWNTAAVAKLIKGDTLLCPKTELIGGDLGSPALQEQALGRIGDFIRAEISQKFEALLSLKTFCDDPNSFKGARPLANILFENHGMIVRPKYLKLIKETDKEARGYLRNMSVQIGFHHVFLRDMLKPASACLLSLLFAFAWDKDGGGTGAPFLPPNGMSSTPDDKTYTESTLNKSGYSRIGPRIIRVDILARLAQMLMQAANEGINKRFRIAQEMMALLGCGFDDFEGVLTALGYKKTITELDDKQLAIEKQALDAFILALAPQDPKNTGETQAVKAPKKPHWEMTLNIYRQKPETSDAGEILYPNTVDLWHYDFKKRTPNSQQKTRYSKSNQAKQNKKLSDKHAHKVKHTSKPIRPEDSPFAALAALKLSSKKNK